MIPFQILILVGNSSWRVENTFHLKLLILVFLLYVFFSVFGSLVLCVYCCSYFLPNFLIKTVLYSWIGLLVPDFGKGILFPYLIFLGNKYMLSCFYYIIFSQFMVVRCFAFIAGVPFCQISWLKQCCTLKLDCLYQTLARECYFSI